MSEILTEIKTLKSIAGNSMKSLEIESQRLNFCTLETKKLDSQNDSSHEWVKIYTNYGCKVYKNNM